MCFSGGKIKDAIWVQRQREFGLNKNLVEKQYRINHNLKGITGG